MKTKMLKSAMLGLVLSTALAACATTDNRQVVSGLGLPAPSAQAETYRSSMVIDPRDNGLTWAQEAQLAAIADEYKVRGHGPLVISYPHGAANEQAAMRAVANARTYLYDAGINWRQISGGTYLADGNENGALVFSFVRYEAVGPDCDMEWHNLALELDNEHHPRFGCALASNLAAMIVDPRDLIMARDADPVDAGRRQEVIERYRRGESTTSQRSNHESGAVSRVGN
jgi:pilus assembly protein CpaD